MDIVAARLRPHSTLLGQELSGCSGSLAFLQFRINTIGFPSWESGKNSFPLNIVVIDAAYAVGYFNSLGYSAGHFAYRRIYCRRKTISLQMTDHFSYPFKSCTSMLNSGSTMMSVLLVSFRTAILRV